MRKLLLSALTISVIGVANAKAGADDADKQMGGMSIVGNDEAPKSLVIVPWKSADLGDALTSQPNDPALGADAATADVVLVEFFDYRCGYCRRSLEGVMALVEEDPKLRVVLKEFPILGPESMLA